MFRRRTDAWVMLKGLTDTSAVDARVELVERRVLRRAGADGGAGGGYAWAVFPATPHGSYTVRVTYPSGARQSGRLVIGHAANSITLEEREADAAH